MPCADTPFSIASPVKPATNPKAILSTFKVFSIQDTLIPFPPKNICSLDALFTSPILN